MLAVESPSNFELDLLPATLLGRLGSICRELEQTCHAFQEALSCSLQSDTSLTASLISSLQEIDRVSQTLGSIAEFTGALEATASGDLINITAALDNVRLHAVREALCGLSSPWTDSKIQASSELF